MIQNDEDLLLKLFIDIAKEYITTGQSSNDKMYELKYGLVKDLSDRGYDQKEVEELVSKIHEKAFGFVSRFEKKANTVYSDFLKNEVFPFLKEVESGDKELKSGEVGKLVEGHLKSLHQNMFDNGIPEYVLQSDLERQTNNIKLEYYITIGDLVKNGKINQDFAASLIEEVDLVVRDKPYEGLECKNIKNGIDNDPIRLLIENFEKAQQSEPKAKAKATTHIDFLHEAANKAATLDGRFPSLKLNERAEYNLSQKFYNAGGVEQAAELIESYRRLAEERLSKPNTSIVQRVCEKVGLSRLVGQDPFLR